ncbi:Alpha-S2-casein-like B [Apodemus speciosus]|uniref:Alpha-S2-casein-like B n=1 Tax=Apodemus speciosus TaxID=105296 RepID=A0ABQ0ERX8_APOSI
MKFIVLSCLLAVALAKQRMKHYSSSEESMDNSQDNFKQNMDVIIFPSQESVEAPIKNKCYQSIQKFKPPQALKGLYQYHIARNPWGHIVNHAFPSTHTLKQYNQKMMDMSVRAREKTMMAEENKNIQDCMNKMKPYSKIAWPQIVKLLHQYQKTMNPWTYNQYPRSQV